MRICNDLSGLKPKIWNRSSEGSWFFRIYYYLMSEWATCTCRLHGIEAHDDRFFFWYSKENRRWWLVGRRFHESSHVEGHLSSAQSAELTTSTDQTAESATRFPSLEPCTALHSGILLNSNTIQIYCSNLTSRSAASKIVDYDWSHKFFVFRIKWSHN